MCVGYVNAQTFSLAIPTNAKTSNTVLRWRQASHGGYGSDEWAIDHVRLTGTARSSLLDVTLFSDNFDTAPPIPYDHFSSICHKFFSLYCLYILSSSGTWWAAISGGTFRTPDCGSIDLPGYSSQAAFFSLSGRRYIQTQLLDLTSAQ